MPVLPGRGVEQRLARHQRAAAQALADHRGGGAILHRAARVARLELGVDLDPGVGLDAAEPGQRRVADQRPHRALERSSGGRDGVAGRAGRGGVGAIGGAHARHVGAVGQPKNKKAREHYAPGPWIRRRGGRCLDHSVTLARHHQDRGGLSGPTTSAGDGRERHDPLSVGQTAGPVKRPGAAPHAPTVTRRDGPGADPA